jgi:hypothetical protein
MTETEVMEKVCWTAILGVLLDDFEAAREMRLVAILVALGLFLLFDRGSQSVWWFPAPVFASFLS